MTTPNLHEIRLPAGDVGGIDIGYPGGDNRTKLDPAEWLGRGYEGVRLIGHASGTRLRAKDGTHDSTLFVGPHDGIVALENLKVHVAKRKAVHMGLALQPVYPRFCLRARGVEFVAEGPDKLTGAREVWAVFTYQCDQDFEDVVFNTQEIAEHDDYSHGGFARKGIRWVRVRVEGCGSQGLKVRHAPNEGRWVRGAKIEVLDSSFKGFGQPHGWRGGGGIVIEGGGADVLVHGTAFWGRPGNFRCLMIDDGGGAFVRPGPANGFVLVRACGFTGGPGRESYDPIMRVGTTWHNPLEPKAPPPWPTAKGVLVEACGVYGERTLAQFSEIPVGKLKVRGCNTEQLQRIAEAHGFDTRFQSQLVGAGGTFVPFSAGVER